MASEKKDGDFEYQPKPWEIPIQYNEFDGVPDGQEPGGAKPIKNDTGKDAPGGDTLSDDDDIQSAFGDDDIFLE